MAEHIKVTAAYFSPTSGTRAYVKEIAGAMSAAVEELDLTRPEVRRQKRQFGPDEVLVLGVPVYYGRVPEVAELVSGLTGSDTPVVLLAVYGNRAIDDALVELQISDDAEQTKNAVEAFSKAFHAAVDAAVKDKLRGAPPKRGGASGITREQILAVKNRAERQRLINENMDLFKGGN